jgi:hypothetical protein
MINRQVLAGFGGTGWNRRRLHRKQAYIRFDFQPILLSNFDQKPWLLALLLPYLKTVFIFK